jgi:hypothetical protein
MYYPCVIHVSPRLGVHGQYMFSIWLRRGLASLPSVGLVQITIIGLEFPNRCYIDVVDFGSLKIKGIGYGHLIFKKFVHNRKNYS